MQKSFLLKLLNKSLVAEFLPVQIITQERLMHFQATYEADFLAQLEDI